MDANWRDYHEMLAERWRGKAASASTHTRRLPAQWTSVFTSCSRMRSIVKTFSIPSSGNNVGEGFIMLPLHSSPAGTRFVRANGDLYATTAVSQRFDRLTMWMGLRRSPAAEGVRGGYWADVRRFLKPVRLAVLRRERGTKGHNCRVHRRRPRPRRGMPG